MLNVSFPRALFGLLLASWPNSITTKFQSWFPLRIAVILRKLLNYCFAFKSRDSVTALDTGTIFTSDDGRPKRSVDAVMYMYVFFKIHNSASRTSESCTRRTLRLYVVFGAPLNSLP